MHRQLHVQKHPRPSPKTPRRVLFKRIGAGTLAAVLTAGLTLGSAAHADKPTPADSQLAGGQVDDQSSGAASSSQTGKQAKKSKVQARPSAGCGTEQKSGNDQLTITSGGADRTSRINIPRAYDSSDPSPLILGFHGNGSDGAEFQNFTGIPALPAVSVFPDGVAKNGKRSWQGAPYASGADDVQYVSDLLDHVQKNYCVDLNRVYATGKSNGGGLVSLLACKLPDRFSAFATVAGAYYPQSTAGCDYSTAAPVLAIHGTGDETMHYDGGNRQGETYPSVRSWIKPWASAATCGRAVERPVGTRGEKVLRTSWRHCSGGNHVELYSVRNGGHVWPGETMYSGGGYATKHFSATATAWKFFKNHPRRAAG